MGKEERGRLDSARANSGLARLGPEEAIVRGEEYSAVWWVQRKYTTGDARSPLFRGTGGPGTRARTHMTSVGI